MLKLILYLFVAFISEILFYKLIRKIDKKERAKLQVWEDNYIDQEIDKIKQNNLKYKTTKRKKENNVKNTICSDTTSPSDC